MKVRVAYTHKGWFGLCPVYFANLNSEEPDIHPRHSLFDGLMDLSQAIFDFLFWMKSTVDPTFMPAWPLQITGELNPPKVIEHEYQEY